MSVKNFLNLTSAISSRRGLGALALLATVGMPMSGYAQALDPNTTPTGGNPTSGNINISTIGTRTDVTQQDLIGSIDWDNFDHGSNALTVFDQQAGNSSWTFNRVVGNIDGARTIIDGTIIANGNIGIIDQNGVIYGNGSSIDVAGLITSTAQDMSVTTDAFTGEVQEFEFSNFGDGSITLNGTISVADAGIAAFVSPTVVNNGIISAKLGKVAFAAGEVVTLDLYGDQLIEIAANSQLQSALLENNGAINAEGGQVIMDAKTANDSINSIINMNGVIDVSSVSMQGGKIVLSAGNRGRVTVGAGAKLNANGTDGGTIEIDGDIINLVSRSEITADAIVGMIPDMVAALIIDEDDAPTDTVVARGGSITINATRRSTISGLVSAVGFGGTVNWFAGDFLALRAGSPVGGQTAGRVRAESVHVDTPLATLDGDIESVNITGTALTVNVAGSTNGAEIQDGIDISAAGATVNIEAGTYIDNLTIDKEGLKLVGKDGAIIQAKTAGNLITITASNVNIDPIIFDGLGIADYGINANLSDNLVVDGNSFTGFLKTNVNVTNSKNVSVKNNTITGGEKGIAGDNVENIKVFDNTITDTTVAGVHVANSNGTGYGGGGKDIDIWGNTVTSASGTGILVQNSAFATVGADALNPFASGLTGGNKISGGTGGIVVEGSDNAQIIFSTINNVGGNGIKVTNSDNSIIDGNHIIAAKVNGIFVKSSDDVYVKGNDIKNVGVWGNVLSGPDNGTHGIFSADSNRSQILSNTISGSAQRGVWSVRSNGVTISDNIIDNSGLQAIATFGTDKVKITGNTGTNSGGQGIAVVNVDDALIDDNTITTTIHDGIFVAKGSSPSNVANNIRITNNIVSDTGDNGIAAKDVTGLTISGNKISGTGDDGIDLDGSVDATIEYNKVGVGGGANNIGGDGIDLDNSAGATIRENIIRNVVENGIDVRGSDDTDILANDIRKVGENGIYVNPSDNIRILDNVIRNAGSDGIYVSEGYNVRIRRNNIKNVEGDGIDVNDNDRVRITDNIIKGAGDHGIEVSKSNNSTEDLFATVVARNTITDTTGNGVDLFKVGNARVVDNIIKDVKNGIKIKNADYVRVRRNEIDDARRNGVQVTNVDEIDFRKNIIKNVRLDGITLDNFGFASFFKNDVRITGDDGLEASNGNYVEFVENIVRKAGFFGGGRHADERGADGISAYDIRGGLDFESYAFGKKVVVAYNDIRKTEDDGVEVTDSDSTWIEGNTIREAGYGDDENYDGADYYGADGIHVRNVRDNLFLPSAPVSPDSVNSEDSSEGGFYGPFGSEYDYDVVIIRNDVRVTGDDGIEVVGEQLKPKKPAPTQTPTLEVEPNFHSTQSGTGSTLVAWNIVRDAGYGANDDGGEGYGGADDGYGADGIHVRGVTANNNTRLPLPLIIDNGNIGDPDGFGYSVEILDNDVKTTGDDGIEVRDSGKTLIALNKVKYTGLDTYEYYVRNWEPDYNFGDHEGDGITVNNVFNKGYFGENSVEIIDNVVNHTGDDGIDVHFSGQTLIADNKIRNSGYGQIPGGSGDGYGGGDEGWGHDGIHVGQVYSGYPNAVTIVRNDIKTTADDGIEVHKSGNTLIKNNKIRNAGAGGGISYGGADRFGADGISVHNISGDDSVKFKGSESNNFDLRILRNDIAVSEDDGIEVRGTHSVLVRNNTVDESGDDGIRVTRDGELNDEMFAQVAFFDEGKPRRRYYQSRVRIIGNTVLNSGTEAPTRPERGDEPTAEFKTKYRFSGGDGIHVDGFDRSVIRRNEVSNSVENGLYVSGARNGRVIVDGNTFTDNDTGASFESGVINFVKEDREGNVRDGNIFNGGRVGLKFSPVETGHYYPSFEPDGPQAVMFEPEPTFAQMKLVDDTVGAQLFNGQSEFFIELDNGAFFNPGTPTLLSALDSTFVTPFGNVTPSSQGNLLSQEEFDFITGRIFDFRDRGDLGLFFFGIEDDFVVNQEELFNTFDPTNFGGGDVRLTLLGLPNTGPDGRTPTGAAALNNIAPAAGGNGGELTPEELNDIESAAGGEDTQETTCWGDATAGAQAGGATTFSFGTTLNADSIEAASNCTRS